MITQFNFIKAWLVAQAKTERGASLVEYALLVALIAVVCIGAVTLLAGGAKKTFSDVGDELSTAGS
jgi:pilus assembly protein Flp/PilA